MNNEIELFFKMSKVGIYCFKNESKKLIQIYGSRNMLDSVNYVFKKLSTGEYKSLNEDINNVVFEVLEVLDNEESVKPMLSKWCSYYLEKGYSFYRDGNIVKYKVKDGILEYNNKYYYSIYLENIRKDKIVVGMFESKEEAIVWKDLHYRNNNIVKLVYAENEVTKRYNK